MAGESKKEYIPPKVEEIKGVAANIVRGLLNENDLISQKLENAHEVARRDPLTGLYNRRAFEEAVNRLIAQYPVSAERRHRKELKYLTILVLDIDNFKNINDTYGHDAGDKVLKKVSEYLTGGFRSEDIVARWGGEEFVIALQNATPRETAKVLRERFKPIQEEIKQEAPRMELEVPEVMTADGQPLLVTFSGGFTDFKIEENDKDLGEIVSNADLALYAAKDEGKNRILEFNAEIMREKRRLKNSPA